jgi:hypothetical protein
MIHNKYQQFLIMLCTDMYSFKLLYNKRYAVCLSVPTNKCLHIGIKEWIFTKIRMNIVI